jgi:elongation factor G
VQSLANLFPQLKKVSAKSLENGILAGFPMTDIKVTVYDGTYHDVDSSEIAFKIAGSMALEDASRRQT